MKKNIFILFVFLAVDSPTLAASFNGYSSASISSASPSSKSLSLQEKIERFVESPDDFLILFERHAAFYKFPKSKLSDLEFRNFLKFAVAKKVTCRIDVDAASAKILRLSTL